MVVRELVTRLGFDADETKLKKYNNAASTLKTGMFAVAAAGAAAAAGVATLVKGAAAAGDAAAKAGARVGVTAEEFQELDYAFQQVAGTATADTDRALGRLSQRIGRAQQGNKKYTASLLDLGFTQQEISSGSITTTQAFEKLQQRLKSSTSAQEASAVAGEILGTRLGRHLGPAIRNNSDALDELRKKARDNFTITNEQAAAGEVFGDKMDDLQRILGNVGTQIGARLLPSAIKMIDVIESWLVQNRVLINQLVDGVVAAVMTAATVIGQLGSAVNAVVQWLGGWERVLTVVAPLLGLIVAAKIIAGIWAMVSAVGVLVGVWWAKAAAVLAATWPILILVGIVAVLAGAVWALWQSVKFVFNNWRMLLDLLLAPIFAIWDALKFVFNAWWSLQKMIWGLLLQFATWLAQGVGLFELWDTLKMMAGWLMNAFGPALSAVRDAFASAFGWVDANVIQPIMSKVNAALDLLKSAGSFFGFGGGGGGGSPAEQAPRNGPASTGGGSRNVNASTRINVKVGGEVTPQMRNEMSREIKTNVRNEFQQALREADNSIPDGE